MSDVWAAVAALDVARECAAQAHRQVMSASQVEWTGAAARAYRDVAGEVLGRLAWLRGEIAEVRGALVRHAVAVEQARATAVR